MLRWKKHFFIILKIHKNLNFLLLSLCVYLFKNCPSQFLSHWESSEPVFCDEELIFLPYKKHNKSLIFSCGLENSNFVVCWELCIPAFIPLGHLYLENNLSVCFWIFLVLLMKSLIKRAYRSRKEKDYKLSQHPKNPIGPN